LASNPHGCEPPFSNRYGEAASSTTKGRGVGTQALYPGLCIHLGARAMTTINPFKLNKIINRNTIKISKLDQVIYVFGMFAIIVIGGKFITLCNHYRFHYFVSSYNYFNYNLAAGYN
jgi:hypothetical protein